MHPIASVHGWSVALVSKCLCGVLKCDCEIVQMIILLHVEVLVNGGTAQNILTIANGQNSTTAATRISDPRFCKTCDIVSINLLV